MDLHLHRVHFLVTMCFCQLFKRLTSYIIQNTRPCLHLLFFRKPFYRATLCVSAVFAVGRRLSVSLSATFMYCIQTAKDIVKFLSQPGSTIILVFRTQAPIHNCKGGIVSAGALNTWGGKICDFRQKSSFISETVQDRTMDAMQR